MFGNADRTRESNWRYAMEERAPARGRTPCAPTRIPDIEPGFARSVFAKTRRVYDYVILDTMCAKVLDLHV